MNTKRTALASALLLVACGGAPAPAPTSATTGPTPAASLTANGDPRTRVTGSVTLSQALASYAPRGQLAVGWVSADEKRALERGEALSMRSVRELATDRLVAVGEAVFLTLATQVPYELEVPDHEVVPFAVLDLCGNVYSALFGGCDGSVLGFGAPLHPKAGKATPADVELSHRTVLEPRAEACSGDRKELVRLVAPSTAGSVHNDTGRRACVYLPPSYAKQRSRRYPVVYALPGLGGDDSAFFRRAVDLDAIQRSVGREAIFVSVDTSTKHGSTYLTDSPAEGDFDSFVASMLVPAIDKAYRTLGRPKEHGRALLGQSTGGFNAVSFGLRHAALFSAIAAMSPDGLDLAAWLAPDGKTIAAPWLHMMRLEDGMKSAGEMASLAASFSPDATRPRGFAWPCDLVTGKLDEPVWSKWLAQSPSVLVAQPAILEAARANLSGHVTLTVAEHDEFDLFGPAKRFADQLVAAGVATTFVPTQGGHTDGIEERERASLEAVLKALDPAKP